MKALDIILAITIGLNMYSIFPQILHQYKNQHVDIVYQMIITKFISGLIFMGIYINLDIFFSAAVAGIGALAWLMIFAQKRIYRERITNEDLKDL